MVKARSESERLEKEKASLGQVREELGRERGTVAALRSQIETLRREHQMELERLIQLSPPFGGRGIG